MSAANFLAIDIDGQSLRFEVYPAFVFEARTTLDAEAAVNGSSKGIKSRDKEVGAGVYLPPGLALGFHPARPHSVDDEQLCAGRGRGTVRRIAVAHVITLALL